jgi:hypothetical protein
VKVNIKSKIIEMVGEWIRSQLMLAMRRREEGVQHGVQTGDPHRGQQLYKELLKHI